MIVQSADQTALVSYATETWRRLKAERIEKERVWMECLLAFNSKFGDNWKNVANFRSRRYIPLSREAVENVCTHMTQGVMPHDDWFSIEGRTPDDDLAAKAMTSLLRWQHFRSGFRQQVARMLKDVCIFGNVPYAVLWKQDYQAQPNLEAHAEGLGRWQAEGGVGPAPQPPMQMVRKYDGPELVVGNIFDYVQDRTITGHYAPRIIRSYKTKAQLELEAQPDAFGYVLYENVDQLGDENTQREASDSMERQILVENGLAPNPVKQVELLECWGDFEIPDGLGQKTLYRNHVLVVGNRSTVLRFEPNPYAHGKCPWQLFTLMEDPNDLYGQGILEPALGLQDVANVRWNQVIEANALTINPMLAYVEDGVFDPDDFTCAPGMLHKVAQKGNLEPLSLPNQSALGMQELGFIKSEFSEATNSMKAFTTADYQKSATEISAQAGMMNSRFTEMIRRVESAAVLPILEMEVQLNQQLMDEAVWVRVTVPQDPGQATDDMGNPIPVPKYETDAPAPMRIAPDDIRGELDIFPVGGTWVANQQQQLAQMIQLTAAFVQAPPMAQWIDPRQYMKTVYEMAGVRDAYKFLKTPQQVQYEQWQQQQQQLAMEAASQGGRGPRQGGHGQAQGQSGPGGIPSVAGAGGPSAPPPSPGGQPSMGGPQSY